MMAEPQTEIKIQDKTESKKDAKITTCMSEECLPHNKPEVQVEKKVDYLSEDSKETDSEDDSEDDDEYYGGSYSHSKQPISEEIETFFGKDFFKTICRRGPDTEYRPHFFAEETDLNVTPEEAVGSELLESLNDFPLHKVTKALARAYIKMTDVRLNPHDEGYTEAFAREGALLMSWILIHHYNETNDHDCRHTIFKIKMDRKWKEKLIKQACLWKPDCNIYLPLLFGLERKVFNKKRSIQEITDLIWKFDRKWKKDPFMIDCKSLYLVGSSEDESEIKSEDEITS